MKNKLKVFIWLILFFSNVELFSNTFSPQKIKILPLSNSVVVKELSTINEKNVAVLESFPNSEYIKLSNGDVIVNRLSFFDATSNKLLYQIDNVEIWKYFSNVSNNIFLIKEKKHEYTIGECHFSAGKLLLLDFNSGYVTEIDENILDWCLSPDGREVYYIKHYDYINSKSIMVGSYKNNKKKDIEIDYSAYLSDSFAIPNLVYLNKKLYISLTEEYIPYMLLQIDFANQNVKNKFTINFDTTQKRYYFEDKNGSVIANYY